MKKITLFILILFTNAYSQTAVNDNPSSASNLTVGSSFLTSVFVSGNEFATNSEDIDSTIPTPNCANYQGSDLWFTATIPNSGNIIVQTRINNTTTDNLLTDTGIAIYSGEIGDFNLIECDDNSGLNSFSKITLINQIPNQQVFIRVWDYGNNDKGSFQISAYDNIPSNDNPIGATTLIVGSNFETNALISENNNATDSEVFDSTISSPGCANYKGRDVWHTLIVPENGNIIIETRAEQNSYNSILDSGLAIYSGEIGNFNLIDCDDNSGLGSFSKVLLTNRSPGEQLYIRTWENGNNDIGTFQITAYSANAPINDDPIDSINLTIGNDFNTNAIVAYINEFTNDSENFDSSIPDPECSVYRGHDIWYTAVVPENGNIIIETQTNNENIFTTDIAIYSGEIGNLNLIECDDFDGVGLFASISLTNQTPGETIYIRAWEDYGDRYGTFLISAFTFDPPTNDNPSGAINLTVGSNFETNSIIASNEFTTDSEEIDSTIPEPECANYKGQDIWYSFTIPKTGNIIIETQADNISSLNNTGIAIYSGEIGSLSLVDCDNDNGSTGSSFSSITLTNQNYGEQFYVRAWENGGNNQDTFLIAAHTFESPINDDPIGAFDLTVGLNFQTNAVVASNIYSTNSEDLNPKLPDPQCANYNGQDVWYSVTIPENGNIIIQTEINDNGNPIYSTGIALYSGNIDNLELITCDDDSNPGLGLFSKIQLANQIAGQKLYVRAWVHSNSLQGDFLISSYTFETPSNDDPIDATNLIVGTNFEENATITNNELATDSEDFDVTIINPSCASYFGQDVWYTTTIPENGNITIETKSSNTSILSNTGLAIYSGTIGNLNLLECDDSDGDDSFSKISLANQIPGNQIYIRAWENGGNLQGDFLISSYTFETPSNDDPIDATNLIVGTDFEENATITNNELATDSEDFDATIVNPSCASYFGQDVWYTTTIPENGNITIETKSSNTSNLSNTGLAIYSGTIGNLNLLECDDSDGDGSFSKISLANQIPGNQIYIRAWEDGGNLQGDFLISTYTFKTPSNDDPNNAISLVVGSNFDDKALIASNNLATNSEDFNNSIPDITCSNYLGGDIWYSVEVPSSGSLIIESKPNEFSTIDSDLAVYSGTINNLSEIRCNDGETINNYYPFIKLENRTPGEIIFVRLWSWGLSTGSEYLLSAYNNESSTLNTNEFSDINNISYYPNPVYDYLIINTKSIINVQSIKLFTSNGKEVSIRTEKSFGIVKLYMNKLANGIYFVHIDTNNKSEVFKIVKQ